MLNHVCEWLQVLDIRSTTPNAAIATTGRCATPTSAAPIASRLERPPQAPALSVVTGYRLATESWSSLQKKLRLVACSSLPTMMAHCNRQVTLTHVLRLSKDRFRLAACGLDMPGGSGNASVLARSSQSQYCDAHLIVIFLDCSRYRVHGVSSSEVQCSFLGESNGSSGAATSASRHADQSVFPRLFRLGFQASTSSAPPNRADHRHRIQIGDAYLTLPLLGSRPMESFGASVWRRLVTDDRPTALYASDQ